MFDLSDISFGSILSIFKKIPSQVTGGLALAGFVFIIAPDFNDESFIVFQTQWKDLTIFMTIIFSCLTLTKWIALYLEQRKIIKNRLRLKLFSQDNKCLLHLAKQQDGSFISQIRCNIDVSNQSDFPMSLIKPSLICPKTKGEVLHAK